MLLLYYSSNISKVIFASELWYGVMEINVDTKNATNLFLLLVY